MAFGKRPAAQAEQAVQTHPSSEPAAALQAGLSHAAIEDQLRILLKMAAASSPEVAAALVSAQDAPMLAGRQRLELSQCLARLGPSLPPGVEVTAFSLLPETVWQGPFGGFLAQFCGLFPAHPFNTLVLSGNEEGELALGLPRPPADAFDDDVANRFLLDIFGQIASSATMCADQVAKGNRTALANVPSQRKQAIWKVVQLAHQTGEARVGKMAMDRHATLFGRALGWPENFQALLKL